MCIGNEPPTEHRNTSMFETQARTWHTTMSQSQQATRPELSLWRHDFYTNLGEELLFKLPFCRRLVHKDKPQLMRLHHKHLTKEPASKMSMRWSSCSIPSIPFAFASCKKPSTFLVPKYSQRHSLTLLPIIQSSPLHAWQWQSGCCQEVCLQLEKAKTHTECVKHLTTQ